MGRAGEDGEGWGGWGGLGRMGEEWCGPAIMSVVGCTVLYQALPGPF